MITKTTGSRVSTTRPQAQTKALAKPKVLVAPEPVKVPTKLPTVSYDKASKIRKWDQNTSLTYDGTTNRFSYDWKQSIKDNWKQLKENFKDLNPKHYFDRKMQGNDELKGAFMVMTSPIWVPVGVIVGVPLRMVFDGILQPLGHAGVGAYNALSKKNND